jgi:DNA-binding NtrC family response regulator
MDQARVLIVDDDPTIRMLLTDILTVEGYQVTTVSDGSMAIHAVRNTPIEIAVIDLQMPGIDGLQVLQQVLQIAPATVAIMITGYGTIDAAVKAMKAGAFDFITKPFSADTVGVVVKKALEFKRLRQEHERLHKAMREHYRQEHVVGDSDAMRRVLEFVEKVADSDSTVLIQGESGTGKELVARMLHFNSSRRDRPLVPVNCGAIPENLLESELFGHEKGAFTGASHTRMGRFELAHGGTIFLDEVAEMPLPLQVKLLRVLQERSFERIGGAKTITVDVRIIAATNQDLEQAVREKRFRHDLYYRLNVIPISIPPLRERRSDIPLLVEHFIARFNRTKQTTVQGVDPDALRTLTAYRWPGNIRELENMIERLVVLKKSGTITVADLPDKIAPQALSTVPTESCVHFSQQGINLVKELDQYETRLIAEALRQAKGITSRAAQLLQLNRTTLVEKLKRKGLDAKAHSCSISA